MDGISTFEKLGGFINFWSEATVLLVPKKFFLKLSPSSRKKTTSG